MIPVVSTVNMININSLMCMIYILLYQLQVWMLIGMQRQNQLMCKSN